MRRCASRMALGVLASLAPAPPASPPAAPAGASASEMLRRLVVGGGVAGGEGRAAEAGAPSAGAPSGPARLPLIPIEYNQLEPMLAAAGGGSDANGPGGYSPFPGNTNGLIIGLTTCARPRTAPSPPPLRHRPFATAPWPANPGYCAP